MKFYICHYTPLQKRFLIQKNHFDKLGIKNYEFVTNFDRENIPEADLKKFGNNLKMSEISLFIKHIESMRKIINENQQYGVIMEDDAILRSNFIENLSFIEKNVPDNFGIIYCGYYQFVKEYLQRCSQLKETPHHIFKIMNREQVYNNAYKSSLFEDMSNIILFPWTGPNKGTDFYIIDNEMCKKFVHYYDNCIENGIKHPIDHFMGLFTYHNKLKNYWTPFSLITHGSLGQFKSAIR
jgi:GR25 family glycosyltransferase involved in LPS biosynthesis